jgi:hypothetical protein
MILQSRSSAPPLQRRAGPMCWMPCLMVGSKFEATTPLGRGCTLPGRQPNCGRGAHQHGSNRIASK